MYNFCPVNWIPSFSIFSRWRSGKESGLLRQETLKSSLSLWVLGVRDYNPPESIFPWEIPRTEDPGQATVHGVTETPMIEPVPTTETSPNGTHNMTVTHGFLFCFVC